MLCLPSASSLLSFSSPSSIGSFRSSTVPGFSQGFYGASGTQRITLRAPLQQIPAARPGMQPHAHPQRGNTSLRLSPVSISALAPIRPLPHSAMGSAITTAVPSPEPSCVHRRHVPASRATSHGCVPPYSPTWVPASSPALTGICSATAELGMVLREEP